MNQQLRIAVALADGWKWNIRKEDGLWWVYRPDGLGAGMTEEITVEYFCSVFKVPHFDTDRNAIIGAIERMSSGEKECLDIAFDRKWESSTPSEILLTPPSTLCRLYLEAKGINYTETP